MYVYPDAEQRLVTPLPSSKRQKQQLHKNTDLQRISIKQPLGMTPYVGCWCGATLLLDYSPENGGDEAMTARLTTFLNEHEDCSPVVEEDVQS